MSASPSRSPRPPRWWLLLVAMAAVLAGCSCKPSPVVPDSATDAGEPDAGAGSAEDAGASDAGKDAGLPPVLKIDKVLPPRAGSAGGAQVLISGSAFVSGFSTRGSAAKKVTTLKFGSNPSLDFQIIDDGTIEAKVPPGKAGLTHVSLENPNGVFVCTGCFTYYDELFLGTLSPKEGPLRGGNEVVINGSGFTPDVEVLFGVFSSPKIDLVSSKQLKVTVPRGQVADAVDVTVYNKNGVGSQRRVYQYYDDLRVSAIAPLTGPLAGGATVVINGKGLSGALSVKFGTQEATSFTVDSPTQITAISPAGIALGAVDLTLTTPRDRWTVRGGHTYADPAGAFAIDAVYPHLGAAAGGQEVTVTGQGLNAVGLAVSFGGQAALIVSVTATTAVVTVPARGAAARKVDVTATSGAQASALPLGFTYRLGVSAIAPAVGPSAGGTAAILTGANLPPDAEFFLGALKATGAGVPTETQASVITPRGSGGAASDLWAREAADLENEATLAAAFTFQEPLAIGRVQPERGAIAGGTLVTVLGAGFGDGTVVSFGLDKAKDLKIVDSHTLTCRTPKGQVGAVDVGVERLGPRDLLAGGFSYFDPRSISGGASGGPLVGTLNITVLDSTRGFFGLPVPLATVMLGIDPATPFQGITDARGQITFSDPSLVKAQAVTVYKEGYETTTVTSVTSENLTVFIARTGGGDGTPGGPPPGVPPSLISGRVTGFKAPRALTANESLEARVFVAQTSLFDGPPFTRPPNKAREKWVLTTDGGEYLVFTRTAGLRATYAVLGVKNKQTGDFAPFLMGVRRGVTTSPDDPAVGQDIVLDMHLDLTVPITVDSPISITSPAGVTPAVNSIYSWLDLGAEGFVPNPKNWNTGTSGSSSVSDTLASLSFPSFPRLDGSNFIFLNEAAAAQGYPVSYYFRRQPGDLSTGVTIGPMLPPPRFTQPTAASGLNGTIAWTVDPGPTPNIHQVLLLKPTLFGNVTLWSMVLPGSETQLVLPPPAVQKLKDEEADSVLFVVVYSSRSPKFNYNQWTYDTLSGVTWSSFTIALSDAFKP